MNMSGQVDAGRGFCPASLCRLLRGIAAGGAPGGGQGGGSAAPAPTSLAPSHSFTIAAILGLKGHDSYSEIPSAASHGQGGGGARGRPRGPSHPSHLSPAPAANSTSSLHHTSKSKRVRTIFTPEQLERLEAEFERQQYMVGPERLYLAHALQLTEAQVKVWFQNRRIKWRKQHLELTQQRLALARRQQLADQLDASSSNSLPEES